MNEKNPFKKGVNVVGSTSKVVNCTFILCVPKSTSLKLHLEASESVFSPPGHSPRCRGGDLHQAQPEDRRVHPAGRLRVEHGRVRRPRLRVLDGPHQLPAFHLPGLHSPSGESDEQLCESWACCVFIHSAVTMFMFVPLSSHLVFLYTFFSELLYENGSF